LAAHPMTTLASRLFALSTSRPWTLRTTSWVELDSLNDDTP